jgi:RND superfamily putative drug exporter
MRIWAAGLVRWRWLVVAVWSALALAGGALGGQVFDQAQAVGQLSADAESLRAERRIQQLVPEGPTVFAVVQDVDPYDPDLVATTTEAAAQLRTLPSVTEVGDLYGAPGGQIGQGNRSTLIRVELRPGASEVEVDAVAAKLRELRSPHVLVGGKPLAERAFADQAIADAALGESLALAALALLLVALLRWGAVAPLGAALAAIATTLLALAGLARLTPVSEYTVNVVTLLGLGLAVDYALLLIWRYREELAGSPVERSEAPGAGPAGSAAGPVEALAATLRTAGRTVLISGGIVAAAMAGLAAFGEPLLAAMAAGGAIVVVVATAAALTLTPAVLVILGGRVTSNGNPRHSRVFLSRSILARLTAVAQRRPDAVAIAVVGGLLLLALPFAGARLENSDARALPTTAESRLAYEAYARDFQRGRPDPVTVVVDAGSGGEAMRDYLDRLNRLPGVDKLELRLNIPAGATVVDLTPETAAQGPAVVQAVREIAAPAAVAVGGPAAELVDYRDSVVGHLPIALGVLLAATGVLLFALTGSLLIPVKAVLMNLLTLVASLGVLAVVFGERLDLTTPVLLFVFIFALSTDYEVFLLARITEEHRAGHETAAAVRRGIARTGPVVTVAAVSLIVVFLGFVLGGLTAVREIGVGMAVAIALDVTVVRGLLLPAAMTLLGRWNWWPRERS